MVTDVGSNVFVDNNLERVRACQSSEACYDGDRKLHVDEADFDDCRDLVADEQVWL